MERQAILLDEELQAVIRNQGMDEVIRINLQDRLVRKKENQVQVSLIKFLNESIDEFASSHVSRVPAIEFTQAMIFVVVKLFNSLHDKPVRH